MSKIYVVTLSWVETLQNAEMIDAIMGRHGDWVRWNGWTWFLATRDNPSSVRSSIMARLKPADSLLIAEITKASLEGWAPQWVWDWFNVRWQNATPQPPQQNPFL